MNLKTLVNQWFKKWEEGDFHKLPVTDNFKHTSPYGTIDGKKEYINLVEANKDKFLGHRFRLHNQIYGNNTACVRYTASKDNFNLEVSEWYFFADGKIEEIIAYYNIEGAISDERKLSMPHNE